MNYKTFVEEQIASIRESVGSGIAVNALSGEWTVGRYSDRTP